MHGMLPDLSLQQKFCNSFMIVFSLHFLLLNWRKVLSKTAVCHTECVILRIPCLILCILCIIQTHIPGLRMQGRVKGTVSRKLGVQSFSLTLSNHLYWDESSRLGINPSSTKIPQNFRFSPMCCCESQFAVATMASPRSQGLVPQPAAWALFSWGRKEAWEGSQNLPLFSPQWA